MLFSDLLLVLNRDEFEPDTNGEIQYALFVNGEAIIKLATSDYLSRYRDCEVTDISVHSPLNSPAQLCVYVRENSKSVF